MAPTRRQFVIFWQQLWQLALRETKRRYKDTLLGWLWIILSPIIQSLIIAFVFVKIVGVTHNGSAPYALMVLSGLTIWNYMASSLNQSMSIFRDNISLVNFQPIPLILLPMANALIKTIDFAVELAVFMLLIGITQHGIPHSFWWGIGPFWFALLLFVVSMCLISSVLGALVRDFGHILTFLLSIWFWVTPIFYPATAIPTSLRIFNLNPMIHFLAAFRDLTINGMLDVDKIAKLIVLSTLLCVAAVILFMSQRKKIYDRP